MDLFILGIGTLALGLCTGTLTGLSASPVVGTLLPLLFTLLTAGGLWAAKREHTSTSTPRLPALIGCQLLAFVFGFMPGLWLGVDAKLRPERIWAIDDRRDPGYPDLSFADMRVLAATITLDTRMEAGGVAASERQRILSELLNAIDRRAGEAKELAPQDVQALNLLLSGEGGKALFPALNYREPVAYSNPDLLFLRPTPSSS